MSSSPPHDAAGGDEQPTRIETRVSGGGSAFVAGRDQHLHFRDGSRTASRAASGTAAGECPYPGLSAFGPGQARWFFGRDRAVALVCQRLDGLLGQATPLIVIGPSGAGKSSLLRAGVVPALDQGRLPAPGSRSWPRALLTPTARPVSALRRALADAGEPGPSERLVILVDQFEEVFTLCGDEAERAEFIDMLARLAAPAADGGDPAGLVVICVRADFYDTCIRYEPLRAALRADPVLLEPMSAAELREVILYPAEDVGLEVEPGLIEVLLRDAGVTGGSGATAYHAGRLPLLAHALRATWQQRQGHLLTVEGYRSTGGIQDAVATTAEQVFAALDPAGRQTTRTLFLRLVRVGEGTDDVCRRVSRQALVHDLPGQVADAVLESFTGSRLLTQERGIVTVTHEALLSAWPRLRGWIDADRAGNLTRQDLDDAAAAWDRDRGDRSLLYRGSRLEEARAWARDHALDLTRTAGDFLAASLRQQRRAVVLRRGAIALLAVLALVASAASVLALQQRGTALQQRTEALTERDQAVYNQTFAEALQLTTGDTALAARLDLAAYHMRPTPDVISRLIDLENAPLSATLNGDASEVYSVAISPDGRTLASGDYDGKIRLWNVADPAHPREVGQPPTVNFDGVPTPVRSVVFSPDGRILASGSWNDTVQLWDVADPAHPRQLGLARAGFIVQAVAFSPDGRMLASEDDYGAVQLWDIGDPAHPETLGPSQKTGFYVGTAVAFSPDGRTLAASGYGGGVRLWDVSRRTLRPLGGALAHDALSVAFGPDGRTLAAAVTPGAVQLWDVSAPAHPRAIGNPLRVSREAVNTVAFSPDGAVLATGSTDGAVRLWDVTYLAAPEELGQPLTAVTGGVDSVAFGPGGLTLASGDHDGAVQLWNLPRTVLADPVGPVSAVAFGPDGRTLTAGDEQAVRLIDTADPAHPRVSGRAAADHGVGSMAFGPDGHTLATGGVDDTIQLWDATDRTHPEALGPAVASSDTVNSVAFSPDGRLLAAGDHDGTIWLWDVTVPAHPRLSSHVKSVTNEVDSVAFSPKGGMLATGDLTGTVELWAVTGSGGLREIGKPFALTTGVIEAVAFSPDGRTLAAGDNDGTIWLVNVANPARPRLPGPPVTTGWTVNSVAFSPDGRMLASGNSDGGVRLWDVADPGQPQAYGQPLAGGVSEINSVTFSPDGRMLASADADGTIRTWDLRISDAIERICATTANTLTAQQWHTYIPQRPYQPPCAGER